MHRAQYEMLMRAQNNSFQGRGGPSRCPAASKAVSGTSVSGVLWKRGCKDAARKQKVSPYSSAPCHPTSFFLQLPQKTPMVALTTCTPHSRISRHEAAATNSEKSVTF